MNFCSRFVTACPVKSAMCLEDGPIRLKYLWAGDAVMVTYVTTTNWPVVPCQQLHRRPQCQPPQLQVSQTNKSDLLIYMEQNYKMSTSYSTIDCWLFTLSKLYSLNWHTIKCMWRGSKYFYLIQESLSYDDSSCHASAYRYLVCVVSFKRLHVAISNCG